MLRIKEIRNDRRMTLDELAEKSGVSKRMLSTYEANQSDITYTKLKQIADALNVNPLVLTGEYELLKPIDVDAINAEFQEMKKESMRNQELISMYKKQNQLLEDHANILKESLNTVKGNNQLLEEKVLYLTKRLSELENLTHSENETLSA